jgi:hypothetical protein
MTSNAKSLIKTVTPVVKFVIRYSRVSKELQALVYVPRH